MTQREREIYTLLRDNPMISQKEIAERLGIQRSSVAVHILNLTRKGWIAGKGYVLNSGRYVAVVGGAGMDLMGFSESPLIEAQSNPGHTSLAPGGVGRNIAENLARLGLEVQLLTAIGEDLYGNQLLDSCREAGIDTRATLRISGASTSLYLALIEPDGEMKIALSSMDILKSIDIEAVRKQDAVLSAASAIVVDANLSSETLAYLTTHYNHRPIYADPVSVTKSFRLTQSLAGIDTLKPNLSELEALSGLVAKTKEQAEIAAKSLCARGIRRIVVSLGAAGALSVTQDQTIYREATPVQVVNATGAGDAFMAGLVYADLEGCDGQRSLENAMAMAEIALESPGAISRQLSAGVLKERLISRGETRKEKSL